MSSAKSQPAGPAAAAPTEASGAAAGGSAAASAAKAAAALSLQQERDRKRAQMRQANLQIWDTGPTDVPQAALDSNLKKNTSFVTRVKQGVGVDAKEQLIKGLGTLKLDKYLEELLQVIPDGMSKCTTAKDSFAAAEILSAFLARFGGPDFAKPLSASITSALAPPHKALLQAMPQEQKERDEAVRIARQKALIRVAAESAMVEIIRTDASVKEAKEGTPGLEWLYAVVKDLLASDREHVNVPLLATLLKAYGPALLSRVPNSDKQAVSALTDKLKETSLSVDEPIQQQSESQAEPHFSAPIEWQVKFRKLCETYFSTLSKRMVKEHMRLQEQDKRNHEAYVRSGEIFEDRQQNYEKMTKNFEKLQEAGKSLSELIGVPLPKLQDHAKAGAFGSVGVNLDAGSSLANGDAEERYASGQSPWEDEETRRFYEEVVDLKDLVPPSLLDLDSSAAEPAVDGWAKQKEDLDSAAAAGRAESNLAPDQATEGKEALSAADSNAPASPLLNVDAGVQSPLLAQTENLAETETDPKEAGKDQDGADEQVSAGPAARVNALLARLPEMTNRTMIDSAAVDFAYLNNKASRRKLTKTLTSIPRSRLDLIPYYARLVATLNRYMPDIGQAVLAYLDEEFRYLQKKKRNDMAETRAKNVRFTSELAKFKITPIFVIFHAIKVCLDDLTGPNVDNMAGFLEGCGRFLLRTPETSDRMKTALELLRRKRAAQNLDHRQVLVLDNAYYQCNPPERKAIEKRIKSPIEQYIQHLMYDVLSKKHYEKVLKLMRKMHWEDPAVVNHIYKVFVKVWKVKFSYIHLVAILLHDLQPYHPDFAIQVIDQVCEDIRLGMETNIFKYNQQRVATIKFLGELYNYRMVNSGLIFDQLWSLTIFGHRNGFAHPNETSSLDAPDDYFRIRLACTLLDTCGVCFDRGSLKKRLDSFLTFLNLYVMSKRQPLPMDVDFMLSDTLDALRPRLAFHKTYEDAAKAVEEMQRSQNVGQVAQQGHEESEEESSESDSDEEDEEDAGRARAGFSGASTPVEGAASDAGNDALAQDEQAVEDESLLMRRERERQLQAEEEDDFARELAKMMTESSSGGGGARATQKGLFDAGIPLLKKQQQQQQAQQSTPTAAGTGSSERELDSNGSNAPAQLMKFSLLSKRGNKVVTHDVDVPVDAAIAVNTRTKQQRDAAEREQLKKLVLSYENHEGDRERDSLAQELGKMGFKVKSRNAG